MSELLDAVGRPADQDIDQVHPSEPLPGAIGAGQQLLRDDLAVGETRRRQAAVAIAALGSRGGLAEIAEQALTPAAGGFSEGDQRVELADRYPLVRLGTVGLVDHPALLHDVR